MRTQVNVNVIRGCEFPNLWHVKVMVDKMDKFHVKVMVDKMDRFHVKVCQDGLILKFQAQQLIQ